MLVDRLSRALAADLPLLTRDGGFIASGTIPASTSCARLRDESRRLVAALQARYAEQSGVAALKIKHNNVLGYYIEVPPKQAERMGEAPFIHRQTIASRVRFTTVELGELEGKIAAPPTRPWPWNSNCSRTCSDEVVGRADDIARGRPCPGRPSTSRRPWPSWRWTGVMPARRSTTAPPSPSRADAIRWSRRLSHATAFVANDCDLGRRTAAVAADRPQHGRQIAPSCARTR